MRRTPGIRLSLIALALVCALPAAAGVVIEMEQRAPGSDKVDGVDTIYTANGKIKIQPADGGDGADEMIFDGDGLWVIDHGKKRSQKIDRDGVTQMTDQLGQAMQQMQAQLEKMPPQQREMMEKMMKGRMPGMDAKEVERRVEKGASEKIGDYSCQNFTLFADDEKVWEVCASNSFDADLVAEAMEGLQSFSSFFEGFRSAAAQMPFAGMMDSPFSQIDQVDGMPVRIRSYANGRQTQESVLRSIKQVDLDASTFQPPSGYKTKNLMDELKKKRR